MRYSALALTVGLLAVSGCSGPAGGGGASRSPQEDVLSEVGDLLRTVTNPRGPAKLSDLDRGHAAYPRAYDAIKSGEVGILWGVPMLGEGDVAKGGGVPVAYEKNAPTAGGWVLLTSGEVKKMTAADIPTIKGSKK